MNVFANVFSGVSGNTIVGISTATKPVLTGGKKNPMQGRITKVMTDASVMVFQNKNSNGYENMVNRRLLKEGKNPDSFKLGSRVWGERIPGTPIVMHNDKEYLEVIFLSSGSIKYKLDGIDIDAQDIIGMKDVEASGQGGLDDTVFIRTFAKESITKIKIGGYTIQ